MRFFKAFVDISLICLEILSKLRICNDTFYQKKGSTIFLIFNSLQTYNKLLKYFKVFLFKIELFII